MAEAFDEMKLTRVQGATAAGITDINADSVDMNGFDAVLFFTTFGAITATAVTSIKVQQSSDDSTFADLAGTGITVADDDDNQTFGVEIIRPEERFLRLVVDRGTANAVVGEIYALQYSADSKPLTSAVTDDATFESHADPAEGTA